MFTEKIRMYNKCPYLLNHVLKIIRDFICTKNRFKGHLGILEK